MPARHPHRQDPLFRNIERWDDGYDPTAAAPEVNMYYPPPPRPTAPSTRTAKYIPKYVTEDRDTRPRSPSSDTQEGARPHRTRYRSPSPARRTHHHRRDEDRRGDRDERHVPPTSRHGRARRPSPRPSKTMPVPSTRPNITTSPSPPPTNRRSYRDRPRSVSPPPRRRHSPAPPRRTKTTHNSPTSAAKHSARDKAAVGVTAAARRPALERSKTAAAALGRNASGLLANPRFQKAAAAALQAGGMAALKQWKAPGAWAGQKGASVATAALGAAAMDAFAKAEVGGSTKAPPPQSAGGGGKKSGGAMNDVGSALGGFLAEQFSRGGGSRRGRR